MRIPNGFQEIFLLRFYLRNDCIISVLCKHLTLRFVTTSAPGLKMGMENDIFWSDRSHLGEVFIFAG